MPTEQTQSPEIELPAPELTVKELIAELERWKEARAGAKKKFIAEPKKQEKKATEADIASVLTRNPTSRLVDRELSDFIQKVRQGRKKISDPDDPGISILAFNHKIGELLPDSSVNPERQAMASITRELCDSKKYPQVLFFTEYGNQSPTPGDSKSDFDMRCVYAGTLSLEDRAAIEKHVLGSIDERFKSHRPIEVHFQGLSEYLNGVVGEDGAVTVTESIDPTLEVTSQRIERSGLVALYTYMSTRMLSHSMREVEALVRKTLWLSEWVPVRVRPTEIAERIVIERGDAVDWMHLFFGSFVRSNSHGEIRGREAWVSRAKRLSKAMIRIGMAKVFAGIPEQNRSAAQRDLTKLLYQTSYLPETIFMSFIRKYGESSLSASVLGLLQQAERLRTDPLYTLDLPSATPLLLNPEFSESQQFNSSIWRGFCAKCELLIFNWASTAGIEFRRTTEDIYDSNATGRALAHVLEMLQTHFEFTEERIDKGETLIRAGQHDDFLYIIPPSQPGDPQGQFEVLFTEPGGSPRRLQRPYSLSIGEIAVLLGIARTAEVRAIDSVLVYKLSGESVRKVLQNRFVKDNFMSELEAREGTGTLLQYLAEYFLRYFTFEFIATVRDRSPGTNGTTITCKESASEIANPEKNAMHQWFVPDYGKTLLQALESKSIPFELIQVKEEEKVLFTSGQENDGLYIVLESGDAESPVVLDSFTGNPSARVELEKDGVFGDGALLSVGKRTATATAKRGATLLKVSVDSFFTLTGFEGAIQGLDDSGPEAQASYKGLLFHLFALNLFRARRDIVDSKQVGVAPS